MSNSETLSRSHEATAAASNVAIGCVGEDKERVFFSTRKYLPIWTTGGLLLTPALEHLLQASSYSPNTIILKPANTDIGTCSRSEILQSFEALAHSANSQ